MLFKIYLWLNTLLQSLWKKITVLCKRGQVTQPVKEQEAPTAGEPAILLPQPFPEAYPAGEPKAPKPPDIQGHDTGLPLKPGFSKDPDKTQLPELPESTALPDFPEQPEPIKPDLTEYYTPGKSYTPTKKTKKGSSLKAKKIKPQKPLKQVKVNKSLLLKPKTKPPQAVKSTKPDTKSSKR